MPGGILLTGGASRRFGSDKAAARAGGETLAARAARCLLLATRPVVEVGPGFTDLACTREDNPGSGPLAGVAAGFAWLAAHGAGDEPALVLATDLPLVTTTLLSFLARFPADPDLAVVPVAGGFRQPLCARYPARAGGRAAALLASGSRSMMALLDDLGAVEISEAQWRVAAPATAFVDVDGPGDLERLGGLDP